MDGFAAAIGDVFQLSFVRRRPWCMARAVICDTIGFLKDRVLCMSGVCQVTTLLASPQFGSVFAPITGVNHKHARRCCVW